MKKNLYLLFAAATVLLLGSCADKSPSYQAIREGFVAPPDTIQTSVYWYWISDNISKEGVERDLESMKQVGINRAFIGNIGLDDLPYGEVKVLTPQWWEIVHAALKKAGELNIEIGIFNSPGWSQSGGPWVIPKMAMRYLDIYEQTVQGPAKFVPLTQKNANPETQNIKIVAFPAPQDADKVVTKRAIELSEGAPIIVDLNSGEQITARSITVKPTKHTINVWVELQVKDGAEYRTVKKFHIDRMNLELNVGFKPYAPIVESFDEVSGSDFRVILTKANQGSGIEELAISALPKVERYSEKSLAKMFQWPLPYWNEYQWKVQPESTDKATVVDPLKVIDLTDKVDAQGNMNWDIPEGKWIVQYMGMTPTGTKNAPASPEATGYEVDKMSKKHIEDHFYAYIGQILDKIPAEDRKTFRVVVQDSYETGGQNFTDTFIEDFKARYGYDPLPYLPTYEGWVVGSRANSDRFLWDMRRLVADKVSYDYVGGLREVCHRHGLTTWLENYGHWGFPGEFLQYGGQSDEIGGEFWSEGELGNIECRAASSSAHIYGKTRVSAEMYTCAGPAFMRYPAMLKQRGDRFMTEGINNALLHVYISQPDDRLPGMNAWFGNEFNRHNTWFSQMDLFVSYLKRSNFMLQQGLNVADVAYFIGEDAPKMTGVMDPALPSGYQFDYINGEVLLRDAFVKEGKLTLPHGTQYGMLVLPKLETMRPELLAKLEQMVMEGLVILGNPPLRSPSLQNQPNADIEVAALAFKMWGDVAGQSSKTVNYGKGMVMYGLDMEQALTRIDCAPDFSYGGDANILYNHRTMSGLEIYYVSNQTDKEQNFEAVFRVTDRQPEIWLPTTGEIRRVDGVVAQKGGTSMPMLLAPNESLFVVFPAKSGKNLKGYSTLVSSTAMVGAWEVKFDQSMRGPAEAVVFESLTDWTKSENPLIKNYSGTAIYSKSFKVAALASGERVMLNLGSLTAMAKVKVNGKYAGGVWTAPYEIDITPYLISGENSLEVEVVSTWMNRLIGDSALPVAQRPTWYPANVWGADAELQPSGLFGPVTLEVRK